MVAEVTPQVSVGLPVYNGEAYLCETLDSLLNQTFTDFEIIICDNASTDDTESIGRKYSLKDSRVHYHRNPKNIGLARNFNRTFALSRSPYFRWAMADDIAGPDLLAECVEALESNPKIVLVVPGWELIDENGDHRTHQHERAQVGEFDWPEQLDQRLRQLAAMVTGPRSLAVLPYLSGLIRSDALWSTGLLGNYPMSDQVLLTELAVRGGFQELRTHTMSIRLHDCSAGHGISTREYDKVWQTFFPDRPPPNLLLWRCQVYLQILRTLHQAAGRRQERLGRTAGYVGATSRQMLRSRGLLRRKMP